MPPVDVHAEVLRNTHLSADYNVLALAAPAIAAAAQPGPVRDDPDGRRAPTRCCGGRSRSSRSCATRPGAPSGDLGAVQADRPRHDAPVRRGRRRSALGASVRSASRSRSCRRRPKPGWWPAASASRPFATLTEALRAAGAPARLFYGGRTRADLFYLDWFARRGVRARPGDRGRQRCGAHGRVTAPLDAALARARRRSRRSRSTRAGPSRC